jgi:glucan 1,3-beta-glucosidase
VQAPLWSYKLALQGGWAPLDPRQAQGHCTTLGQSGGAFTGNLTAAQVGDTPGATPPTLSTYVWPPTSLAGTPLAQLAQYTVAGPVPTLPVPTFSGAAASATVSLGNGWTDPADTTLMAIPVSGCTYPDGWNALNSVAPACSLNVANAKRDAMPPTPAGV